MANAANHLKSLQTKHAQLEKEIKSETLRPHPDDNHLKDLKVRKLRIKEEIYKAANSNI